MPAINIKMIEITSMLAVPPIILSLKLSIHLYYKTKDKIFNHKNMTTTFLRYDKKKILSTICRKDFY